MGPFILLGCRGVWKLSLCKSTAMLFAWQIIQLSSQLDSISLLSWNNLHVPQGTAQKTQWMEGWKKPGQPHKLYLLCTAQALNLRPVAFQNESNNWLHLLVWWLIPFNGGPCNFRRNSILRCLFSLTLLQVMLLSWKKFNV